MSRFHSWPPEHVELLGTMTDGALARQLGISTKAVAKYRCRRGIRAALSKALIRDAIQADQVELRQMLTETPQMTTREVAENMGWSMWTALNRLRDCPGLTRSRVGRVWLWSSRRAA